MANFQSALAVLTRVRMENYLARVTNGLGARNIPYTRTHGKQSLGSQIQGEREDILAAEADLRRLDAEVDEQEARIKRLRIEARRVQTSIANGGGAGIAGGRASDSLMARLKNKGFGISRSKLELGPLELGRGGLGLNNGFMRAVAGRAFVVGIAGNVIGGSMSLYADAQDRVKAIKQVGGTNGEAARAIGGAVAGGVRDTLGGLTGVDAITKGILRLRGMSEEDASAKMEKFYRDMFSTREEIARRKQAGKAAQEQAFAEVEQQIEKQQNMISRTLPTTFRVRGRADLKRYRAELQEANKGLTEAKREMYRNQETEKLRKARVLE